MADAKVVSNTGKRPFVVFKIECSDERMKYPMRVDCLVYPRMNEDPNVVASKYRQGMLIWVTGDVSARAYLGKNDGKPRGTLHIYCNQASVLAMTSVSQTPEGDEFDAAAAAFDEPRPVRPPAPPGAYDPLSRPSPVPQRRRVVPQLVEPPQENEPY